MRPHFFSWLMIIPLFLFGITIDLQDPLFDDGVLTTSLGGVIEGEGFRFQARKMCYENRGSVHTLVAEGEIMIEYGQYRLIGQRLFYNFLTQTGTLYQGVTEIEPWIIQADEITLTPSKEIIVKNGSASISQDPQTSWKLHIDQAKLNRDSVFHAKGVSASFIRLPLFWIPSMGINLKRYFNSPFSYVARWGGGEGLHLGLIARVIAQDNLDIQVRTDYRAKFGFGGGFDINWHNDAANETYQAVNYIAKDTSPADQNIHTRYRYLGEYHKQYSDGKTELHLTYDKLSDKEMATDFNNRGLKLKTAKRTQLNVRREESNFIMTGVARTRLNTFQTVKNELPTVAVNFKPAPLGKSGIISHNTFQLSYLDLEYADEFERPSDYNSSRYEMHNSLYKTFFLGNLRWIPEAEYIGIYYGNNENHHERWATMGRFASDLSVDFNRTTCDYKHIVTPYINYEYTTTPSTSVNDHFIFDISDGLVKTSSLRLGTRHQYFRQSSCGIFRAMEADLYTYAFFSAKRFDKTIPKYHLELNTWPSNRLKYTLQSGWDFEHSQLDYLNTRIEYTHSRHFAISSEYRYRSRFNLREVDRTNFSLDFFRSETELLSSPLSDRHQTFLLRTLYKFQPNWAIELEGRKGWGRTTQKGFLEYQVNLLAIFRSASKLRLSYRRRENEKSRFSIHYSFGLTKPDEEMLYCRRLPFEL